MMFSAQEVSVDTGQYTGTYLTFESSDSQTALQFLFNAIVLQTGNPRRWRISKSRNCVYSAEHMWVIRSDKTLNQVAACGYELARILDHVQGLPPRVYELTDRINEELTTGGVS